MPGLDDIGLGRLSRGLTIRQQEELLRRRSSPGLLASIGRVLDFPGRKVREAIVGRREATGRDVLRHLGLAERNQPGFDAGDVAGFGAEVLLDPLNLVGGVGAVTKAGKIPARLARLRPEIRSAVQAARLGEGAAKAGAKADLGALLAARRGLLEEAATRGISPTLGRTLGEQARLGQRSLLRLNVPFTSPELNIRGAPVLDRLGRAGRALRGTPFVTGAGKLFVPGFGQDPALKALSERFVGRGGREAMRLGAEQGEELAGRMGALEVETGLARPELERTLARTRESLGAPDRIRNRIASWRARRDSLEQGLRRGAEARHGAKREAWVKGIVGRAGDTAREREAAAQELLRTHPSAEVRRNAESLLKGMTPGHAADVRRLLQEGSDIQALPGAVPGRPGTPGPRPELTNRLGLIGQLGRPEARRIRTLLAQSDEIQARASARAAAIKNLPIPPGAYKPIAGKLKRLDEAFLPRIAQASTKLQDAEAVLAKAPGGVKGLAADLADRQAAILAEKQRLGVPINELRSVTKSYMERILSREAKDWLKKSGNEDVFVAAMTRANRIREGSQIKRVDEFIETFTDQANEILVKLKPDLQGPWFDLDAARSFPQAYVRSQGAINAAKLAQSVIAEFGRVTQAGDVPLADFLKRAPLRFALPTKIPAGKLGIPPDIAQQFFEAVQKIQSPEEMGALVRAWDGVTKVYKTLLTRPFPGFYVRNLFSDTALSWLDEGANPALLARAVKEAADQQTRAFYADRGLFTSTRVHELAIEAGISGPQGLFKRFPRVQSKISKLNKRAEVLEAVPRIWHYLSMRAKGLTDPEAVLRVKKALLDYSALTPFERQVMQRAVPFYSWTRKALPRVLAAAFEDPKRWALLARATTQPTQQSETEIPGYIRRSGAIPFGTNAQGDPRFLFGTGSPLEELNKIDFSSAEGTLPGMLKQALRQAGIQLNPLIRAPAEVATGQDLFFDQPILESDKAEAILGKIPGLREAVGFREEALSGGGVRFAGDPQALHLLRASPLSRFVRTASQVGNVVAGIDPRTSRGADLLQVLTGARMASLDQADRARAALGQATEEAMPLRLEGKVGEFKALFATDKEDPETAAVLQRSSELRKLLRAYRERPPAP